MPVLVNKTKKTLVIHAIRGRTIVLGSSKRVILSAHSASLGPIVALLNSGALAICAQPSVEVVPVAVEQPPVEVAPVAVEQPPVEVAPVAVEKTHGAEPEPESIIAKRRGRPSRTDD